MALLEICKITIPAAGGGNGAATYYFQTKKDTYKGDVSAQTGVEKAPDTFDNDEPIVPIAQLILSNKLDRRYVEVKKGDKKRLVEILIRRDKVEEMMAQPCPLENKAFGDFGTVKAIRGKTKDTFR